MREDVRAVGRMYLVLATDVEQLLLADNDRSR